jgi:hypothetical protein
VPWMSPAKRGYDVATITIVSPISLALRVTR